MRRISIRCVLGNGYLYRFGAFVNLDLHAWNVADERGEFAAYDLLVLLADAVDFAVGEVLVLPIVNEKLREPCAGVDLEV